MRMPLVDESHRSERFHDWTVHCQFVTLWASVIVLVMLADNRETWLASRDPLIALRTVFVLAKNAAPIRK